MKQETIFLVVLSCLIAPGFSVSIYEYFTGDGITEGLMATDNVFRLNGKEIKILSGSLHYFRVHPDNWRLRIRQYKAAGLNTLDVYVPWNLHEPMKDEFDFGDLGLTQFSKAGFLDIRRFLEIAKEEDMLVIFRPGPYICGEWEFGGLPSWLLHENPMYFRMSYGPYEERAEVYMMRLLQEVKDFQFYTENGQKGGPIIMTQIENEYGNYGYTDYPRDKDHLRFLKSVLRKGGIESLLFTSDTPTSTADWGNVDYELMTANFKWNSDKELQRIKEIRSDAPILVSEYWPGWFDHWFEDQHNILSNDDFREILGNIFGANASVNFYMFHGGTNFGYMNGANILMVNGIEVPPVYAPDVTSYDYDAPITESGQYRQKYFSTKEMIAEYDPLYNIIDRPEVPEEPKLVYYDNVNMEQVLTLKQILDDYPQPELVEQYQKTKSMEEINYINNNGMSYGYIVYRKEVSLKPGSKLTIRGHIRDLAQVFVNGVMISEPILSSIHLLTTFGSWAIRDSELTIPEGVSCEETCTLDILVENLGRANFGVPHTFNQKKGLWEGDILIDGQVIDDWYHYPLALDQPDSKLFKFIKQKIAEPREKVTEPLELGFKILVGNLTISEDTEINDTFFEFGYAWLSGWSHGAVFVNEFCVGRYHLAGPQKTLYIPGALLHHGDNEILILENYNGENEIMFTKFPNYGPTLEKEVDKENPLDVQINLLNNEKTDPVEYVQP